MYVSELYTRELNACKISPVMRTVPAPDISETREAFTIRWSVFYNPFFMRTIARTVAHKRSDYIMYNRE